MQVSLNCKPKMRIYKGETYTAPSILKIDGKVVTAYDVERIEFAFSKDLIKTYPGDVEVAKDYKTFIVNLSPEETMTLNRDEDKIYQARITFKDGIVKFTKPIPFVVIDTVFSEVITDE